MLVLMMYSTDFFPLGYDHQVLNPHNVHYPQESLDLYHPLRIISYYQIYMVKRRLEVPVSTILVHYLSIISDFWTEKGVLGVIMKVLQVE